MSLASSRRIRPAILGFAAVCAASFAAAAASTDVPSPDRQFAAKAAAGGMAEVEGGKVAEQKAANPQVKQFGARMVADHGKANEELMRLAEAKGMSLPKEPDAKARKTMSAMQKLSGGAFDRAYMDHMVADHKKDIAAFEKEAKSGKDADVKAFAAKTLPTLREHLQLAQAADAAVRSGKP